MKKLHKKLSLRTEMVRALDAVRLVDAAGGASVKIRCNVTITCPTVCADTMCADCGTITITQ